MSADCSVGSNPLAQLNKHAQQNPALRQVGYQNPASNVAQNFKTHVNEVSNANRFQMDQFMNRSPGFSDGQLGMAPVPSAILSHGPRFGLKKQDSGSSNMSAGDTAQHSRSWGNEFNSRSPQQGLASRVNNVERNLKYNGYDVAAIHGDLSQQQRTQALNEFKAGKCNLLLATDVAARGLDIPNVKTVINLTFPLTVEDYVHRIGRTCLLYTSRCV